MRDRPTDKETALRNVVRAMQEAIELDVTVAELRNAILEGYLNPFIETDNQTVLKPTEVIKERMHDANL